MASTLPVLTFHAIDDRKSVISYSPEVFSGFMAKLNESGYSTLTLQEAAGCVRKGGPFPDRSFVITFDDGYRSVYEEAFPVLQRYGMTATVYITVGDKGAASQKSRLPSMQGRSMLSWQEIREMQRCGIVFDAHTLTHPDLTRMSYKDAEDEICRSKMIIEDVLGSEVFSFAYPFGYYDLQSIEIAKKHFACAVTDRMGLVTGRSDPYLLERVDAYYFRTGRSSDIVFKKAFPWYIKFLYGKRWVRRKILFR